MYVRGLILLLFVSCGDNNYMTSGISGKCEFDVACSQLCYTKFQCNQQQDELNRCLQGDVYYAQE